MPTVNPRVNVTLPPALDALVSRLARHRSISKAQVLRELLEAAEPALQRVVSLLDAASSAAPDVLSSLAGSMMRAQERIEDVLAGSLARIDGASDLVDQAEAIRPRRAARATDTAPRAGAGGRAGNPPASNRGVRSEDEGPGKRGKARAGGR